MPNQDKPDPPQDVNRREFLRGTSVATLMALMGGVKISAQDAAKAGSAPKIEPETKKPVGPPVNFGVVGLGNWGREILNTLARLPNAPVVAVCDHYPVSLRRGAELTPKAQKYDDYRKLLEQPDVQAVVVATPSHLHRDVVLAALGAGKHVYCEAPLAATIEDARTIAAAAKAAVKQVFQAGLQLRSEPQRLFLLPFIRSGATGNTVKARTQWHKKTSWRFTSINPEREKAINWRLSNESSPGLIGEIGIHQVDDMSVFLNAHPVSVTGFSSIMNWKDGRDVPDTVQAVFEYPGGVRLTCDYSLANSFDADYEVLYGTDAAVMLRENKAWLFKEVDSALLGWEVYARKDVFYKETGIALVADATKSTPKPEGVEEPPYTNTPLSFALEAFINNASEVGSAMEDFLATFGTADNKALAQHRSTIKLMTAAGYLEGYVATVVALKANEAILKNQKLEFQKDWFELG